MILSALFYIGKAQMGYCGTMLATLGAHRPSCLFEVFYMALRKLPRAVDSPISPLHQF